MWKLAITVLTAVALTRPLLSVAGDNPAHSGAKANSYVPHSRAKHHVYGAPIQPAIVGHAKSSHRKLAPKKRASSAAKE